MTKGILFNTEMVKAILDGRKTVTRRVIQPHYKDGEAGFRINRRTVDGVITGIEYYDEEECGTGRYIQPPYQIGDTLYVRESAMITAYGGSDSGYYIDCHFCNGENKRFTVPFEEYKRVMNKCVKIWDEKNPYKSPKFSPYWLTKHEARIWLKVTDVRVERLQDIDGQGIAREGVDNGKSNPSMGVRWENMQRMAFEKLWNSTIKKQDLDKYGWNANPYVWVIEFERIEKGDI